jgi:hypothetical protein
MLDIGMATSLSVVSALSDAALLAQVTALAERERQATAELIATLAELDARRLYLGAGYSSLFTYCTHVLHLSEHGAYGRIEAARAARRFPTILDRLAAGRLTLTSVCLLAPVLKEDNHVELLDAACNKSKRDVELLVAHVRPQPAVPTSVRKLPPPRSSDRHEAAVDLTADMCQSPGEKNAAALPPAGVMPPPACVHPPLRPAIVRPLAPEHFKVQFTISRATHDKLRCAQDLLRHSIPTGDPATIFDRALTLLIEDLEKRKIAAAVRPRPPQPSPGRSRHIPAAVRRQVWARDGRQCAFVGTNGRCDERGFLELHHVVPFAAGGETTAENLQLRCRAHNAYEAELYFGPSMVREVAAPFYT